MLPVSGSRKLVSPASKPDVSLRSQKVLADTTTSAISSRLMAGDSSASVMIGCSSSTIALPATHQAPLDVHILTHTPAMIHQQITGSLVGSAAPRWVRVTGRDPGPAPGP